MKKLAIMFVMLLGSVATMQAQSNTTFDFSCEVIDNEPEVTLFTQSQISDLMSASFTEESLNVYVQNYMHSTGVSKVITITIVSTDEVNGAIMINNDGEVILYSNLAEALEIAAFLVSE